MMATVQTHSPSLADENENEDTQLLSNCVQRFGSVIWIKRINDRIEMLCICESL